MPVVQVPPQATEQNLPNGFVASPEESEIQARNPLPRLALHLQPPLVSETLLRVPR